MQNQQQGLTLIELIIAIALGMVLMLSATQIFLSSYRVYTSNQELSEVQEIGRFALRSITKDIRNAGYKGACLSQPRNHVKDNENALWSLDEGAILGWLADDVPDFIPDEVSSAGVFVQFAGGGVADFEGKDSNTVNTQELSWQTTSLASPVAKNEVGIIADGIGCDVFYNMSDSSASIRKDAALGAAHGREWTHEYNRRFEVLKIYGVAYYLAEYQGMPALYRASVDYDLNVIEEQSYVLAPNVRSLHIAYGLNESGAVGEYVEADAVDNWGQVISTKVSLGIEVASGLQREFTIIVGLRNRLP